MINVIYHCAGMGNWKEVVREQFAILQRVGLTRISAIHVGEGVDWFIEEAKRNNIDMWLARHDDNLEVFETAAMSLVQSTAAKSNDPILYFHTKGVSQPDDSSRAAWRQLMNKHVLENWQENVAALAEYDVVGVNWQPCSSPHWISKPWWMRPHFSGNFWIASAKWVRGLPDFNIYNIGVGSRYASEVWIGSIPGCRYKSLACFDQPFWLKDFDWSQLTMAARLNLGCGRWHPGGWINIDIDPSTNPNRVEDASVLSSVSNGSVHEIYAGHILDIIPDMTTALVRWYDVLIPGGKLTVTSCDLAGAVKLWKAGSDFPGIKEPADRGIIAISTGSTDRDKLVFPHQRVFDAQSLALCLKAVGFVDFKVVDSHPLMVVKSSNLGWQVAIECRKPEKQ